MLVFLPCPPGKSVGNVVTKTTIASFQADSPQAVMLVGQHWHRQERQCFTGHWDPLFGLHPYHTLLAELCCQAPEKWQCTECLFFLLPSSLKQLPLNCCQQDLNFIPVFSFVGTKTQILRSVGEILLEIRQDIKEKQQRQIGGWTAFA